MNIRALLVQLIQYPDDLDETLATVEVWIRDKNGIVMSKKSVPVARTTIDGTIIVEQKDLRKAPITKC